MIKELIIGSTPLEMTIALLEDGQVVEVFIERERTRGILGNIYKGRVTKIVPGMQAAFVDIGLGRSAFLFVSDFLEESYPGVEEGFESQADADWAATEGPGTGAESLAADDGRNEASRERSVRTSILPPRISVDSGTGVVPVGAGRVAAGWAPTILPELLSGFDSPSRGAGGSGGGKSNGAPGKSSRRNRSRKRRGGGNAAHLSIGRVLQENQEILVQVSKEPIGRKGARITSHVAFPGRYLVYMPTVSHVGVSRRIVSDEERRRLRRLIRELRRDFTKGGFIVRTVAENHSKEELRRDMEYLTRLWDRVRREGQRMAAPAQVYAEPSLSERVVRDYLSADFRQVHIDDEEEYERTLEMVRRLSPELASRIKLYPKDSDILHDYGIDAEIEKALRPKVWLKSGGHIVINQTEALVAIDVNTGRYVGKTDSLEDTITRTNLEVVKELARQIRLRNIGGIIIIDFIDMSDSANQRQVLEALRRELSKDKAPFKVLDFNEFGLVALTRKRDKQSLERTLSQRCSVCEGTGLTRSVRTVCYSVHHQVQKMLPLSPDAKSMTIRCHPEIGKALRGGENLVLKEIKKLTGQKVRVKTDPLLPIEQFEVIGN
ncbi:MAG: Rne/Rng family ribonuclease [Candidatus Aminicenantes bacterium]|nr:Rne/Rng family ribonuclease [Candidatus Aminicenantes bacterium]